VVKWAVSIKCSLSGVTAGVVSYSKAFKKEAEILKIDLFSTLKKSPNRWRYFRYEEE